MLFLGEEGFYVVYRMFSLFEERGWGVGKETWGGGELKWENGKSEFDTKKRGGKKKIKALT